MAKVYDNATDIITFARGSSGTALRRVGYGDDLAITFSKTGDNGTNTITLYDDGYDINQVDASSIAEVQINGTFEANKTYVLAGDYTVSSGSFKIDQSNLAGGSITVSGYTVFRPLTAVTSIGIYRNAIPSAATFRNISVREVFLDRATDPFVLFNHPDDIPRIEYGSDGSLKGLLIEEQRTNLLLNSDNPATQVATLPAGSHTLSFVGGPSVTGIDDTIEEVIAVDVFVYDTSKDTDGGAWRTGSLAQASSWYNETLNTDFRGSRREFPEVAVIVAEEHTITIYDGDDPSLPMWMIFPQNRGALGGVTTADKDLTSVAMLNGVLVGGYGNGLSYVNFLSEVLERGASVNTSNVGVLPFNVSERDEVPSGLGGTLNLEIVNSAVNDVAMTVLPGAPTDPATGLKVPTIAVATDGGISVIRDDGTVVDYRDAATDRIYNSVLFDNGYVFGRNQNSQKYFGYSLGSVDKDTADVQVFRTGFIDGSYVGSAFLSATQGQDSITSGADGAHAIASIEGLTQTQQIKTPANGMVAYTTSDYATGWMNGDIKLAALADTTVETLSGEELVVDDFDNWVGDFDAPADVNSWSNDGISIISHNASGYLDIDRNGSSVDAGRRTAHTQISGLTVGETYVVSVNLIAMNAKFSLTIYNTSFGIVLEGDIVAATGPYSLTFVASQTSHVIGLGARDSAAATVAVNNVSVRLADPDRSVNGNGLGVHGSITKEPVATGADVVAYSGFSSSNYLEQPYNPDLDFGAYTGTAGTGDFSVMGWLKTTETNEKSVLHRSLSGQGGGLHVQTRNDGTIRLYLSSDTSFVSVVTSSEAVNTGTWQFFTFYRKDGVVSVRINGGEATSVSFTSDISYTDTVTKVGERNDTSKPWPGSLALLRISATAPTADQILKIYNDEKVLFQPNAKATLTGSSDAVTALAHDPDTDLLHVGTSGGRSVFYGLRRVNETATAVTTAISAVDGLIVEQ